jgi:protein-L-isoaspartate(D-aspartate) O-methyltransferase
VSDDDHPPFADFDRQREAMVAEQLAARDITDEALLEVFRRIPRHRFIDPGYWDEAYADHPVRIGSGQTISQPYIVAFMTQALRAGPDAHVLEVGTGSGYQTAVLAALGCRVETVERHEELTERAAAVLEDLGLAERVEFHIGDGTLGLPEEAPYDRIIVTAAAPQPPPALREQLRPDGGRLVLPVGRTRQRLIALTRHQSEFDEEHLLDVRFVPLIGDQGF